jgi:hypothetical protein
MAEFCHQCALDVMGSLAFKIKELPSPGYYRLINCEGCGLCQIDYAGRCVSKDCKAFHGCKWSIRVQNGMVSSEFFLDNRSLLKEIDRWKESFKVFVNIVDLPSKKIYCCCGAKYNDYYGSENTLYKESIKIETVLLP